MMHNEQQGKVMSWPALAFCLYQVRSPRAGWLESILERLFRVGVQTSSGFTCALVDVLEPTAISRKGAVGLAKQRRRK
ncbi:MAG: hypothetical protein DMG97_14795 [Acidobacteria bacterium]|nr:MAG: hypothetical protein DMG97_14795 [Acidobacteriota bacterium]